MHKQSFSIQQLLLKQIQIPNKLLTSYVSLGLNEKEVMLLLQLQRFIQEGIDFPTPDQLSTYVTMKEQECALLLRGLVQKGVLTIAQQEEQGGKLTEAYCLNALWDKLFQPEENTQQDPETSEGTIFILFEQEFGRPLSPFEIETINAWLDQDSIAPALIKAALRESVLMGKLNFKYIDRILREWKKKGIHTVEQARMSSKQFHARQNTSSLSGTPEKPRDTSFYYNWLEGED
ncbi:MULTISPECIES: DnaD domain-containing protein [Clostridia]|uniref:DnaD domain-containing protein n=1 Tax=Clostridia TaxID=186801 RepID=UPI000EA2AEC0|nr:MULTISPECIES: DnaD domain-containing protein [Clostridia]NBJ71469.1 DnaD domain protein [Roseburia sp. 1XD42-34]RKI74489.1 DnaD domain protein [Clostridium sp. 1xD42-85]